MLCHDPALIGKHAGPWKHILRNAQRDQTRAAAYSMRTVRTVILHFMCIDANTVPLAPHGLVCKVNMLQFTPVPCQQMSDVWSLVHLARIARRGGYPLRMPSDFPRTLRVALFRATTAACVDALDHDARWERFSPTFNMCAAPPSLLCQ